MGCMRDKGDARVCSECGFEEGTAPERPGQLWPRTILSDKYVIGRVLGQGGFGITYLARDLLLDRKLAIKEHFPREICTRGRDEHTVQPLSARQNDEYTYGLKKFVEEGRALAGFYDHPGIVLLLDFFEANGTAYIVMAYVAGMTFKQYLQNHGGKIGFGPALDIITPVMDALREVHRRGMLHRDVSPDNIYINEKKEVKILDFGSTRYAVREFSQVPAVKWGYSPIEQYGQAGKQGTWTDVYATAATLYRAITGQDPPDAPDRLKADPLIPPSRLGVSIPPACEKALLKALSVQAKDRFQTMDHFWNALVPYEPPPSLPSKENGSSGTIWSVVWMVAACLLLLSTVSFAVMWVRARKPIPHVPHAPDTSLALQGQIVDLNSSLAARQKNLDDEATQNTALEAKASKLEKQNQTLTARLETVKSENAAIAGDRNALKEQVRTATATNENLGAQLGSLQQVVKNVQEQLSARKAVHMTGYRFFYWNGDWDLKSQTAPPQGISDFESKSLRYLLCVIQGSNPLVGKPFYSSAMDVRYFGPDKQLKKHTVVGASAAPGAALWTAYSGWGNDKAGSFSRGDWTVEVWCEGQKLGELHFRVH
jgi:serine/threonine protein kinase